RMDGSARTIDTQLEEIPRTLGRLSQSVQMLETLLARERSQITEAETLIAGQTAQLKANGEALAHARKKAAQATSARETHEGEREVEGYRRTIKEREEEIRRLNDTVVAKKASLVEREKEFSEARDLLELEQVAAKEKIAVLEQERNQLLNGRNELVAQISNM